MFKYVYIINAIIIINLSNMVDNHYWMKQWQVAVV